LPGLPSMSSIADSLNAAGAMSLKWSIQDSQKVVNAAADSVDWRKEFQAFLKDDVNKLRFKDAYTISDETDGNVRTVRFDARTNKQEIRSVHYTFSDGKLKHYQITKHRDNLLSSSWQSFTFSENSYTLEVDQRIPKLFNNRQYVHGSILPKGTVWRINFDLGDDQMPILMIEQDDRLLIKNGEELLSFQNVAGTNQYRSDYFNAYFEWDNLNDSIRTGKWINAKYDQERVIAVSARADQPTRFFVEESIDTAQTNLSGDHRMVFYNDSGEPSDTALLSLRQTRHLLEGSVLTPTGDYRYLVGVIRNDSLLLSSMDGTHCYYFKAAIEGNKLNGVFKAGTKWRQQWEAELGATYELPDAEQLTSIRSNERLSFRLADLDGRFVSLDDKRFQQKPVLISIMGTWCSNCLDETLFLNEVKENYGSSVEIVALDFELVSDSAKAIENIKRYKENLDIQYPILLAGLKTTKQKVLETLPALSAMVSYPTLIVVDRNHDVVRIHTGFSGPATGDRYYERFRSEYINLIDSVTAS
jgi:thiol-disulfide isomerase/thioredoxin